MQAIPAGSHGLLQWIPYLPYLWVNTSMFFFLGTGTNEHLLLERGMWGPRIWMGGFSGYENRDHVRISVEGKEVM